MIHEVAEKHIKIRNPPKTKKIPNFAELQRRQLLDLEQIKHQNRKDTKPIPFHLH